MKPIREIFPTTLYARWVNATWPINTGRPNPVSRLPQAAQAAADRQWENEGGAIKPAPKTPV